MKRISELNNLLEQFFDDYHFAEKEDVLRFYDLKITVTLCDILISLKEVVSNLPGFNVYVELDIGDELDLEKPCDAYLDNIANVRIDKKVDDNLYFFSKDGLEKYLKENNALENINNIFSKSIDISFDTLSVKFYPISSSKVEVLNRDKLSLIKYIKPLNADAQSFLIKDLNKWITKTEYLDNCNNVWIQASSIRLLCAIGFEFSLVSQEIILEIVGDRRKKVVYSQKLKVTRDFFTILNNITSWIYVEATDIDSRHSIFNYELSRNIGELLELEDGNLSNKVFEDAFENSKLVYRYHLLNSSKELNKSLVELNKSLFEHISKIRQNTIDLINTLWKDFATSFGILVLNYTIKKESLPSFYFTFFGVGLCLYLISSFFLSTRISFWFYKSMKKNLIEWRYRIYGYISDSDFEKFTLQPLKKAQKNYLFTFWIILILYIIIISSIFHLVLNIKISKYGF